MASNKKIYIVEKSDTTRNSLKKLFEEKGYEITETTSTEQITSEKQLSSYACIITSLDFSKGGEGESYLNELIVHAPHTPIVLLSSNINVAKTVESLQKGVFYIVKKPFMLREVEDAVMEAVSAKQKQEGIESLLNNLHSQFLFKVPGALGQIESVIDHLAEETLNWKIITSQEDTPFRAAVRAALHNAVLHGNKANDKKNVKIRQSISQTKCNITISDEGDGFHPEDYISKENLSTSKTNGGLLKVYSFMDEVSFNEKGNEIRMLKNKSEE